MWSYVEEYIFMKSTIFFTFGENITIYDLVITIQIMLTDMYFSSMKATPSLFIYGRIIYLRKD